jgi:hypothetical protein
LSVYKSRTVVVFSKQIAFLDVSLTAWSKHEDASSDSASGKKGVEHASLEAFSIGLDCYGSLCTFSNIANGLAERNGGSFARNVEAHRAGRDVSDLSILNDTK